MPDTEVLYEYDSKPGERLRFGYSTWKNSPQYHIRIYVRSRDFSSGEEIWLPTRGGLTITKQEFPEFVKGLVKIKEHIGTK